jgi:hypothetical protein
MIGFALHELPRKSAARASERKRGRFFVSILLKGAEKTPFIKWMIGNALCR